MSLTIIGIQLNNEKQTVGAGQYIIRIHNLYLLLSE